MNAAEVLADTETRLEIDPAWRSASASRVHGAGTGRGSHCSTGERRACLFVAATGNGRGRAERYPASRRRDETIALILETERRLLAALTPDELRVRLAMAELELKAKIAKRNGG